VPAVDHSIPLATGFPGLILQYRAYHILKTKNNKQWTEIFFISNRCEVGTICSKYFLQEMYCTCHYYTF